MNASQVPPGFRFHPTDEELVDYYLRKKVASRRIDLDVIKDVDLYKFEPWDLQELCRLGAEEQNECYFFSHKDKKYPTGTRTNRATTSGFWKATGRDKPIYVKHVLIGMRKTLVFYKGRAPNGQKSDWIMHEYRLEKNENGSTQEYGWVVCKLFKKRVPMTIRAREHASNWYDEQGCLTEDLTPSKSSTSQPSVHHHHHHHLLSSYSREVRLNYPIMAHETCHILPHVESPKMPTYTNSECAFIISPDEAVQPGHQLQIVSIFSSPESMDQTADHQMMDWRVLDKFVASQLSNDVAPQGPEYCHVDGLSQVLERQRQQDVAGEYATSTSTTSGQTDPYGK